MKRKTGSQRVEGMAEVQLIYHNTVKVEDRIRITNADEAYRVFLNSWDPGKLELQEQLKVVFLNQAAHVLGIMELSTGGVHYTVADPRILFAAALKVAAVSMILCHNHPSGNLKPSDADLRMTEKVKAAGELLEIKLHDHLIISREAYYSFAEHGDL